MIIALKHCLRQTTNKVERKYRSVRNTQTHTETQILPREVCKTEKVNTSTQLQCKIELINLSIFCLDHWADPCCNVPRGGWGKGINVGVCVATVKSGA